MANLSQWQKITRVLPGLPFGDGKDGAYSSATIPTLVYKSCTGTAASTTLTASTTSPFEVGDILLLHQSRGTGVGQWEINRVTAVGSGSYTLQVALKYTYVSPAQAIKIPRYTDVTCSGTWTVSDWNGSIGAISVLACKNFTNDGTLVLSGITGSTDGTATGRGYAGAPSTNVKNTAGKKGEGTVGAGGGTGTTPNGSGGGGGGLQGYEGAGGAGNASAGGAGTGGSGGLASGSADLTSITFGGGGGGGGTRNDGSAPYIGGGGGVGGGILFIFAKNIIKAGSTTLNGGKGGSFNYGGHGGGGAGGSALFVCQTATFGSDTVTATGGIAGGIGASLSGAGSVGRIAVHHSGPITGTTNPTFTDQTDTSLTENASFGSMI